MVKEEWKHIFSNKMLMISLTAILFVPIIYAGMFLWSFWDPYGKLDKVPVAIVNQDNGATVEGKKLTVGDDCDHLRAGLQRTAAPRHPALGGPAHPRRGHPRRVA